VTRISCAWKPTIARCRRASRWRGPPDVPARAGWWPRNTTPPGSDWCPVPAASSAVSAGINAKDAICLRLVGKTTKGEDHKRAVGELARAGQTGKELESTFSRLLGLRTTAQYQAEGVARGDAVKAVECATLMVDTAGQVVSS
jgi:hypothetical protein